MIEDGWMFAFGKKKSNFVDFVDVIYRRLSMSILRLSTRFAVHSNQIKIEKNILYINGYIGIACHTHYNFNIITYDTSVHIPMVRDKMQ